MPTLTVTKTFEWNVLNGLRLLRRFLWHIGEGRLQWYVVTAYPSHGICDNTCGSDREICLSQTLMAGSVEELAKRLKAARWSKLIKKVQVWSRPALECDIRKDERDGFDPSCDYLGDVVFCIPEMYSWIKRGDCPALDDLINGSTQLVWYTEYVNVTPSIFISVGSAPIRGEKLGTINNGSFLHFGLGDGNGGGIGQTIDVSSVFATWPNFGERAPATSPGATIFNSSQIAFILQWTDFPLDPLWCNWTQRFGDTGHTGAEYYAVDMLCDGYTVIGNGPPRPTLGAHVYCACGGPDITNRVESISGSTIVIKHTLTTQAGQSNIPLFQFASFMPVDIPCTMAESYLEPILFAQVEELRTKSGFIPSLLMFSHNFQFMNIPSSFGLSYNKHRGCWEYSRYLSDRTGKWVFRCELTEGWMLSVQIMKEGTKEMSKFVIHFDEPGLFGITKPTLALRYNLKTNSVVSKYRVSNSVIRDGAGTFKGWPELQLEIGL